MVQRTKPKGIKRLTALVLICTTMSPWHSAQAQNKDKVRGVLQITTEEQVTGRTLAQSTYQIDVLFKNTTSTKTIPRRHSCTTESESGTCRVALQWPRGTSPEDWKPVRATIKGDPLSDADAARGCVFSQEAARIKKSATASGVKWNINKKALRTCTVAPTPTPRQTPDQLDGELAIIWPFDETSGNTAHDSSARNIHAAWNGESIPIWSSQHAPTAEENTGSLSFDGSGHFLEVGILDSRDSSFSYSFWAKPLEALPPSAFQKSDIGFAGCYAGQSVIGGYSDVGNTAGVVINVGTNGIAVIEHSSNFAPIVAFYQGVFTDWVHIAVVSRSAENLSLYVNGSAVDTAIRTAKTRILQMKEVGISQVCSYSLHHYHGFLDQMRIFSRALSVDEVQGFATASD